MSSKLDWEDVEAFLSEQISKKKNIQEGLIELNTLFRKATKHDFLSIIDTERIKEEFNKWIVSVFSSEKLPQNIKSLHFGLFTIADPAYNNGEDTIAAYLMGSTLTPEEDDWNCWDDDSFLPENKYIILTDFIILDKLQKKIESENDLETLLFNGILNLVIINQLGSHVDLIFHDTLRKKGSFFIGSGFDGGDTFILGKLTRNGLA